jgi:hypothetical protein
MNILNLLRNSHNYSDMCSILDDISVHHEYVDIDRDARNLSLRVCTACVSALESQKIPKFSLSNNLFRGSLPPDLRYITWIEENTHSMELLHDTSCTDYREGAS